LNVPDDFTQIVVCRFGRTSTHTGVEFVDRAIRFDPRTVLGNATTTQQVGFASIAAFGVDLHEHSARVSPPTPDRWRARVPDLARATLARVLR
jgi:hypothetical protein